MTPVPLSISECADLWSKANVLQSDSDRRRWDCAPTALASSGTSRAQAMADALGVDVTTVHNLAKAQMMYLYLAGTIPMAADYLRDQHSYIRFAEMWKKHDRYELSPGDCAMFLESDLSIDAMCAHVENMHNPVPEYLRRLNNKQGRSWLEKIATEPDTDQPAKVTRAARLFKGRIEEAG